ncbi:MAG: PEP/pyruvate-binding domain-containing protein, partial [Deltaproteobacteria bacterium]|nr:PEP/pyruvate-binding domain-containing protein [Deltaproteobacteria bacterium]
MFKFLKRFLKEEVDEATRLQGQFDHFRHLLTENNQALETMADMEEKLSGDFLFDTGYLETQSDRLLASVSGMVAELNLLTGGRYPELAPICRRLGENIRLELAAVPTIPETPFILPLSALSQDLAPAVGSKMANLGEIGNRVGLPVPQGFAITAAAYKFFLEEARLSGELEERLAQAPIHDLESLELESREIQDLIRRAPLPAELEQAVTQAAKSLPTPWLAVRSSAVGEDTEFSFAGQFATLLNVDAARLPDHYKEIVASKFT